MKRLFFNKAIRILLFTDGLTLIASAMLGPIYALFVSKIGGDLLDASLTGAIFALAAGVATLIAGKYADKIKESELIIVFGYCLIGIGYLLYLLVNSILFLFIIQIIIGFGNAIYAPAFDALFSKHLHKRRTGTAWGVWEAINYFSITIGAVIGGLLVHFWGFHVIFIIMAVLCFLSATYIYFLPRRVL